MQSCHFFSIRNPYFSILSLFSIFLAASCISTPKGTPAATRISNAAAVAVAISTGTRTTAAPDSTGTGVSTRIEIFILGVMSCAAISNRDAIVELTDNASNILASITLSDKWQGVTAAIIQKGQTYRAKLKSQRNGVILSEVSATYAGDAPWNLFVDANCPN